MLWCTDMTTVTYPVGPLGCLRHTYARIICPNVHPRNDGRWITFDVKVKKRTKKGSRTASRGTAHPQDGCHTRYACMPPKRLRHPMLWNDSVVGCSLCPTQTYVFGPAKKIPSEPPRSALLRQDDTHVIGLNWITERRQRLSSADDTIMAIAPGRTNEMETIRSEVRGV